MPDLIPHLSDRPEREPAPPDDRERSRFYASPRWKRLRRRVLARQPLCAHCLEKGQLTEATLVHHKIERLDRPDLAYTIENLEGLCGSCHSIHHNAKRKQKPGPGPISMKSSPRQDPASTARRTGPRKATSDRV